MAHLRRNLVIVVVGIVMVAAAITTTTGNSDTTTVNAVNDTADIELIDSTSGTTDDTLPAELGPARYQERGGPELDR